MCGMVGIISKDSLANDEKNLFKQALICDMLRGINSTGLFAVDKDGMVDSYKKAVNGADFLGLKAAQQIIDDQRNIAIIGHNRAATVGKATSDNAHPFEYGNITLIHNGTLHNRVHLPDHNQFGVDSANVTHSFNEIGVEETCKKMEGAYALIWHDLSDNSLSLLRNDQRDLYVATIKGGATIFIVSEIEMLYWLAKRNNIKVDNTYLLKTHTRVKLYLDGPGEERLKPEIKEMPKYQHSFGTSYGHNSSQVPRQHEGKAYNTQANVRQHPNNGHVGSHYDRSEAAEKWLNLYDYQLDGPVMFTLTHFDKPSGMYRLGVWHGFTDDGIPIEIDNSKMHEFDPGEEYISVIDGLEKLKVGNKDTVIKVIWRDCEKLEDWAVRNDEVISREEYIKGPEGEFIPKKQWENLVRSGCVECGDPLFEGEADKIVWTMERNPICATCVGTYEQEFGSIQ